MHTTKNHSETDPTTSATRVRGTLDVAPRRRIGSVVQSVMAISQHPARPVSSVPGRDRATTDVDVRDFKAVYDRWVLEVARWIRAMGGPAADRDDLLQEVFVVVHRRLPEFDGENLPGWLYRITAHQVRDFRRKLWVKHIFSRSVPLTESMPAPGPTPVMSVEARQKRDFLEGLLSRLSLPLRTAFMLFEIEGYTAEEIAQMQGAPLNTVRARILRARKKLSALIEASR
jgi:RNA polymerase sigma-70 factor (ECF subfamily)